jgi:hypothetical protein
MGTELSNRDTVLSLAYRYSGRQLNFRGDLWKDMVLIFGMFKGI